MFVASESDDDEHLVAGAVQDTDKTYVECLPNELLLNIFSRLSVKDICRCAQVCRLWHRLTKQKVLWTDVLPTQWAQGKVFFCALNIIENLSYFCLTRLRKASHVQQFIDFIDYRHL